MDCPPRYRMCDSRMEWTFNNRPPGVFCLILKSQNLTETGCDLGHTQAVFQVEVG